MSRTVHPVPRSIGIFGGAFDPPHWAHRALAEAALQQLDLDQLYVLPTGHAWHKSRALTAADHRVAMCEEAFAGLERVSIDVREIHRKGPSYTADTLAEISAEQPDARLYLLLGADQLLAFRTWSRWQEVMEHATLVVANRAVHIGADADPQQQVEMDLSGVDLDYLPLEMPLRNISATAVRAHVHGASRRFPDLDVLVPEGVARYISEHHLYQNAQ